MNATKQRIPRILKLAELYLDATGPATAGLPFEERLRLKGQRRENLRLEVERMKRSRAGFTLIEMLVSVGVVLVMMTLFTVIFQMATQAMSTQKGNAENDQRVRLVETLLRNDLNTATVTKVSPIVQLQHRTFQSVMPYRANELAPPSNSVTGGRVGYLTISENNQDDDTDDVLQLTVQIFGGTDQLFGHAAILKDAAGKADWSNQPEYDDVYGYTNSVGDSDTAEVAYFLRNGTLYRRVMLLRTPPIYVSGTTPTPEPSNDTGGTLDFTQYTNGTLSFWRDFDYSAYFDSGTGLPQFVGSKNLDSSNVITLLDPQYRWGFDASGTAGASRGLPREFDSNNKFLGRFTQAETSDVAFAWPGRFVAGTAPNPHTSGTTVTLTNGKISQYSAGTRVSEDALMTNVLAFDIKVWDNAASLGPDGTAGTATDPTRGAYGSDDGDWRDIGHAGLYGFYNANSCQNNYFGPNRYDTWGPNIDIDGVAGIDAPPYRPLYLGPDGTAGTFSNPTLGADGSDDIVPLTAIKITIRIKDKTTGQVRDVTGVYNLTP